MIKIFKKECIASSSKRQRRNVAIKDFSQVNAAYNIKFSDVRALSEESMATGEISTESVSNAANQCNLAGEEEAAVQLEAIVLPDTNMVVPVQESDTARESLQIEESPAHTPYVEAAEIPQDKSASTSNQQIIEAAVEITRVCNEEDLQEEEDGSDKRTR